MSERLIDGRQQVPRRALMEKFLLRDGARGAPERIKVQRCKISGSLKYPAVVGVISSRELN